MSQLTLSPDGKTSPEYYKQVRIYPEGKTIKVTDVNYTYVMVLKIFFSSEKWVNLAGDNTQLKNVKLVREG